jgi:hypothetical protein
VAKECASCGWIRPTMTLSAAASACGRRCGGPKWGRQWATTVTRPHRGHRLGLLVKTEMMTWLAEAEPRLERIATLNAAANQYMIGINEALGYQVAGRPYLDVELAVDAALPPGDRRRAGRP